MNLSKAKATTCQARVPSASSDHKVVAAMGQAGPCRHVLAPRVDQASPTWCWAALTLSGQDADHLIGEVLLPRQFPEPRCDSGAHLPGSA